MASLAEIEERITALELDARSLKVIVISLLGGVAAGNDDPRGVVLAVKEAAQVMVDNIDLDGVADPEKAKKEIRENVSNVLDSIQFLLK